MFKKNQITNRTKRGILLKVAIALVLALLTVLAINSKTIINSLSNNFSQQMSAANYTDIEIKVYGGSGGVSNGTKIDDAVLEIVKLANTTGGTNISSKLDLLNFISEVNAGNNKAGATINLVADVNLEQSEINDYTITGDFAGIFDGQSHTIRGLNSKGLFNNVSTSGKIKNLTIASSTLKGPGGLVNSNYGTIENCYMDQTTSIVGSSSSGGFAGINYGTIVGCNNGAYIEAPSIGGIAYDNRGTITLCTNGGKLKGSTTYGIIGGISAINKATISKCKNTGNLELTNITLTSQIGGIAGSNNSADSIIEVCYNSGQIIASSNISTDGQCVYIGGIDGSKDNNASASESAKIRNCFNSRSISLTDNLSSTSKLNYMVGGIGCANLYAEITNCYNKAEITVESQNDNADAILKLGGIAVNAKKIIKSHNSSVLNFSNVLSDDALTSGIVTNIYDLDDLSGCYYRSSTKYKGYSDEDDDNTKTKKSTSTGIPSLLSSVNTVGDSTAEYYVTSDDTIEIKEFADGTVGAGSGSGSGSGAESSINWSNATTYYSTNGVVTINRLTSGTYAYRLTSVPSNYVLNSEVFKIRVEDNGKIYNPDTGEEIDKTNLLIVVSRKASSGTADPETVNFKLKTNFVQNGFYYTAPNVNLRIQCDEISFNQVVTTNAVGEVEFSVIMPEALQYTFILNQLDNITGNVINHTECGLALRFEEDDGNLSLRGNNLVAGLDPGRKMVYEYTAKEDEVDLNKTDIFLSIICKKAKAVENIVIKNVAEDDPSIYLIGSKYEINIDIYDALGQYVETKSFTKTTNMYGEITIPDVLIKASAVIRLKQIQAAKGYILNDTEYQVKILRATDMNLEVLPGDTTLPKKATNAYVSNGEVNIITESQRIGSGGGGGGGSGTQDPLTTPYRIVMRTELIDSDNLEVTGVHYEFTISEDDQNWNNDPDNPVPNTDTLPFERVTKAEIVRDR